MQITGNTILITGGGGGIGRALAEALHARGNKVIVTGRDAAKLRDIEKANPGIEGRQLDVDDAAAIKAFAQQVTREFPALNVLINNAGIMRAENVTAGETEIAEATVSTNLLAPIRLTAAMLPHLLGQANAAVLMVSSGVAFVPLAFTPTYGATKAAVHFYAQALRIQLRDTPVQVIELVPPYVQTQLMGAAQAADPNAMPLADYIAETISILETQPDAEEILVERVHFQRWAEKEGRYDSTLKVFNP